jgi:hypothetical protein
MRNVNLKAAAGVRNDVPLERFGKSDLASGVNVDIDKTGKVSRRAGQRQVLAGADIHSLTQTSSRMFFVDGTDLLELHPSFTTSPLKTGLAIGRRMTFLGLNQKVYFMNGADAGVIVGSHVQRLGVEVPAPVHVVAIGDDGDYGVTMTYVRNDGTESGARGYVFVRSAEIPSMLLTLPVSTDPDVVSKRLYITTMDGEVPYLAAEVDNATLSYQHSELGPLAIVCSTQFLSPMPSGDVLAAYNGRLYIARGNLLVYSEPYNYETCDMRMNYIQFPDRVTIIAPVKDGIYVGTETETLFLRGADPAEFAAETVAPVGSIFGTLVYADPGFVTKDGLKGQAPMWMTTRGVCAATESGVFTELTSGRYVLPDATSGAGLYRYQRGVPQYISVLS